MVKVLLIGFGGFAGTVFRYWVNEVISNRYGEDFPTGTLIINVVGCFLAGLLFYFLYNRIPVNPTIRAVIFVGVLGGFTTFSAYGIQTFTLVRDGEVVLALANVIASNILGLVLVGAGYSLAKMI